MNRQFPLIIEELTGSRRRIELSERAMPMRGPSWEGGQRTKLRWYPGNPIATQQVLGPEEMTTEFQGIWKDRFLSGTVKVRGFDRIVLAEQLIAAMDDIRVSGNTLSVQWGPFARIGIMQTFRASPERIEDIPWAATFEWSQRGAQQPTQRAGFVGSPLPSLRNRLNAFDDALAFEPLGVVQQYRAALVSNIANMRTQAGVVFDNVRAVESALDTPASVFGALATAAESIRFESEELVGRLVDTPRTIAQTSDRVTDILRVESWRRTVAFRSGRFSAETIRTRREVERGRRPSNLKVITVSGEMTLRDISFREYGTADSWQTIADFNGITTSSVSAGTLLVIPPPPSSRSVSRSDDVSP